MDKLDQFMRDYDNRNKKKQAPQKKIIDIEEKIPSLKKKKKRKRNIRFLSLFGLLFMALLALVYFYSPISHIGVITIKGEHSLKSDAYYLKQSGLKEGDSLWDFETDYIEKLLKQQPSVKKVVVERSWLNKVVINITENKPVAYIYSHNKFHYVLENGKIFQTDEKQVSNILPVFTGFKEDKQLEVVASQFEQIPSDVGVLVSQVKPMPTKLNTHLLKIVMTDENTVFVNDNEITKNMKNYIAYIEQVDGQKGIINFDGEQTFNPYAIKKEENK